MNRNSGSEAALHLLLVDDSAAILQALGDYLCQSGYQVEKARDGIAALRLIEASRYDLALVDVRMPGLDGLAFLSKAHEICPQMPVVLITGHADMEMAIQALRLGAADFLTKPVKLLEIDAAIEKARQLRTLRQQQRHLRETIRGIQTAEALRARNRLFVGLSPATRQVREQIRQAVESRCETILITGETGTGKEVVAHELHFLAHAEERPFIAVNCPSLPEALVESELFGHMKGAFTGAIADRAGYFELAHGGTLFLDEVADLSPAAQARFLRVLEARAFRRVGGSREIHVEVRVIAATNTSLEGQVHAGKFRTDLFYRLNSYAIHLLPLRERREDILPLAKHFLSGYALQRNLHFEGFSPAATELLANYPFPGNARELRNLVERAAMLCRSGHLQPEHFFLPAPAPAPTLAVPPQEEPERQRILQALEAARWNRRRAAQALDMPYSTLRYKMARLGIRA
ncbi:MAG: sigma-54-dependent Fis family transcriptional regulator [Candidatus Latescibacteria bacterium]|nr:sigma-54-dependent Fis family transcriptional regulator [Candidatus Latescibacterota bacterium]